MQYMEVVDSIGNWHKEERCTLRRFIELGRLKTGLILTLSNGEEAGYRESAFKLVIGDCTASVGLNDVANQQGKNWDEELNKGLLDNYVIKVKHINLSFAVD